MIPWRAAANSGRPISRPRERGADRELPALGAAWQEASQALDPPALAPSPALGGSGRAGGGQDATCARAGHSCRRRAAAPGRAMGLMPAARAFSSCRACPRPLCRLPACCAPAAPGRGSTGCGDRGRGARGPCGRVAIVAGARDQEMVPKGLESHVRACLCRWEEERATPSIPFPVRGLTCVKRLKEFAEDPPHPLLL